MNRTAEDKLAIIEEVIDVFYMLFDSFDYHARNDKNTIGTNLSYLILCVVKDICFQPDEGSFGFIDVLDETLEVNHPIWKFIEQNTTTSTKGTTHENNQNQQNNH